MLSNLVLLVRQIKSIMKKTFVILGIASTLMFSSCASDRSDNASNDSTMTDSSTMDAAPMGTDSEAMSTDTAAMSTSQTSPDSTAVIP
jgi:hypothetical protein